MKIIPTQILASLLAAAPALTDAWAFNTGGPFSVMTPMVVTPSSRARYYLKRSRGNCIGNSAGPGPSSSSCISNLSDLASRTSPRYEITDDDEKFLVAIDVPGVKADGIQINLEEDGQVLSIAGQRESTTGSIDSTSRFTSRFAQKFYLDPTVDIDNFTANLKNGVLVVTAPKDMKRIEMNIRSIPITTTDEVIAEEEEEEEAVDVPQNDAEDTIKAEAEAEEDEGEGDADHDEGGESIEIEGE